MRGNRGGADCWWVWLLYRYRSSVGGAGGYRKCEGRNIVGSLPSSSSPTADWRFHLVLRKKKAEWLPWKPGIMSKDQSLTA